MKSQNEKANIFRALHERDGAFVIPNPWDVGSARLMEGLGFEALATTSSGFAFTLGREDGQVTLGEKIRHLGKLCSATNLPVSADLENGFADSPEGVARTFRLAKEMGIVGGSIEDQSKDPAHPIYDFAHAVERVTAVVETCRTFDFDFMVTARTENLLNDYKDVDETIRRLQAFERAGADVLFAPGLRTLEEIRLVTSSVSKPVNVLAPLAPGITLSELADAGVKRVSIGGAMLQAALAATVKAGEALLEFGVYDW